MGIKFSMEQETLVNLGQRTSTESDDLGALVRRLVEAAEPLESVFNGPAKSAFNNFKSKTDDIATALNNALVGILGSIEGQNNAFVTAADEGAAAHTSADGSSDFSGQAVLDRIAPGA